MAKRFTDSRKWDDGWFLDLPNDGKMLWIYLLDKCNHAGIYKKSSKLEKCCLGFSITAETLKPFGDRVKPVDEDKFFIPKFVDFQYGVLNPSVNCHKSVLEELKRTLKEPLIKGCSTLKDKDKDKDQVKVISEETISKNILSIIINKYCMLKGISYTNQQYGHYAKRAKELYLLADKNENEVIRVLEVGAKNYADKKLDWTIDTIVKRFPELKAGEQCRRPMIY